MDKQKFLGKQRQRRRFHTRKRIRGTADRPRMSVNRSNRNIEVQVIDDFEGKTLVSVSSRDGETGSGISYGGNCDAAATIEKAVAEKAIAAGIKAVKFDRGDSRYHGRVAALADAAREAGLEL